MSCLAPVLYASTDCSRWLAEYKQGVLQRHAARRLRAAKYQLTAMLHKPAPTAPHPMRRRLGPLESLRRFQIDCGELDQPPTPVNEAVVPPLPVEPTLALVSMLEPPPELPPPAVPDVVPFTPEVPSLINVPTTPVEVIGSPTPTPEPGSLILVVTGAVAMAEVARRKAQLRVQV